MSNQRRAVTAAMTEGLSFQPPRISINNSMFTLIDRAGNEMQCNLVDPQLGRYLDVIIAGANSNKSKIFYDGDWTPNSTEPPVCWSDNGVAPSTGAQTPQNATCNGCEWNKIGSDTSKRTGKGIKACQDRKKLACFVVGMPMTDLYQFQVTPGALKELGAYGKWVSGHPSRSGQGAADVSEVITRLYFVQGAVGVVGFAAVGPIDDQQDLAIEHAWTNNRVAEITGSNDMPIQGLLPAPQAQQQLAPPVQREVQRLEPPAQQQWAPPVAAQPAPVTQNVTPRQAPPPPPQPVWDAAAGRWVLPGAADPAPVGMRPELAMPYGAAAGNPTPVEDPYAVPAFLQRPPAGASPPPAQPPQNFSAAAPSTGKGKGRGGPRAGAGRPPVTAPPTAQAEPAQHTQQPGAAFGAPPAQAPQHAPFASPSGAAPQSQQFGMAPAGAPPPDMSAALDRAFATPLPAR